MLCKKKSSASKLHHLKKVEQLKKMRDTASWTTNKHTKRWASKLWASYFSKQKQNKWKNNKIFTLLFFSFSVCVKISTTKTNPIHLFWCLSDPYKSHPRSSGLSLFTIHDPKVYLDPRSTSGVDSQSIDGVAGAPPEEYFHYYLLRLLVCHYPKPK